MGLTICTLSEFNNIYISLLLLKYFVRYLSQIICTVCAVASMRCQFCFSDMIFLRRFLAFPLAPQVHRLQYQYLLQKSLNSTDSNQLVCCQIMLQSLKSFPLSYSGVIFVTLSCKVPFLKSNFRVVTLTPRHITTPPLRHSSSITWMNSTNIPICHSVISQLSLCKQWHPRTKQALPLATTLNMQLLLPHKHKGKVSF